MSGPFFFIFPPLTLLCGVTWSESNYPEHNGLDITLIIIHTPDNKFEYQYSHSQLLEIEKESMLLMVCDYQYLTKPIANGQA